MKRENIDGRPIFSDEVWNQMCFIGNLLCNLGYNESIRKPNLFYKKIDYKSNKKDKQGIIFSDLRGEQDFPIWEDPRPYLYFFKDLTYGLFAKELILLKRNKCPIKNFTQSFWCYFEIIPTGYCRKCKIDIINSIDWEELILRYDEIVPRIELHYCDICKKDEYEKKRQREKEKKRREILRILCRLCGKGDEKIVRHHISYNPSETIKVCRSCHGIIHSCKFPHYLWKEKRPIKKEKEVQYCKICNDVHIKNSVIAMKHTIFAKFQQVTYLRRKIMKNNIDLKQRRIYNKQALQTKKEIDSLIGELSPSAKKEVQKMMNKFEFHKKKLKKENIMKFV